MSKFLADEIIDNAAAVLIEPHYCIDKSYEVMQKTGVLMMFFDFKHYYISGLCGFG